MRLRGDGSAGVLARIGIAVCGLPLEHSELLSPPADVKEGRSFLYRRT
ncbi:class I SAM-dependent methyltransferase [Rhizobium ruizarguesonis]|nr:class I SAM-dependent methyltransferase [Rhizobium ruizarguesonis]